MCLGIRQILVQWVLSQVGQILIFGNRTEPGSDFAPSIVAIYTVDCLTERFLPVLPQCPDCGPMTSDIGKPSENAGDKRRPCPA